MSTQLLKTKLYAPRSRPRRVSRSRLDERLEEGMEGRLTLVCAPAGFGKTTLLSDWSHRSGHPVAWVSLDEADDDPKRFLSYLTAALETVKSNLGESVWPMLCTPQPPVAEAVLTTIINGISDIEEDFALVLDDYHLVSSGTVHEALAFLIEHQPPTMHVLVAARSVPPLPLARLRGRGQLTELRAADLRFAPEEASAFLEEVMGLELSADVVAALEERTEGWISGLQLAAHAMRNRRDLSGFIEGSAGDDRHVFDYLAEEVFCYQSAEVQDFLLKTSVLERLSVPLCDALTGGRNGQQMLERLEGDNLFVVPLDDGRHWYRYHQLFADFLRERLRRTRPDLETGLHRRAGEWYEEAGHLSEAVDHALAAKDYEDAVRLMESHGDAMWFRGETAMLLRWLEALPDEYLRDRPSLCIFRAGVLVHTGRRDGFEPWLQTAERAARTVADEEQRAHWLGKADVIRARAAYMREDVPAIIELSEKALGLISEEDHYLREEISLNLGHAYCANGDLIRAGEAFAEAVTTGHAKGNLRVAMFAAWNRAALEMLKGRRREAEDILRQTLRLADELDKNSSPSTGMIHVGIGELLYERGDLDGAERHLARSIELGRRGGEAVILSSACSHLARVKTARGDKESSRSLIESAASMVRWPFMGARRARLLLMHGDVEAAGRWADEYSASEDYRDYPRDGEKIVVSRVLAARGELAAALELLETLLEATEANGMTGRVVEILALEALVLDELDHPGEALAALERALVLAEPEGYYRTFVDEGPRMARLLSRLLIERRDGAFSAEYAERMISGILAESARPNGNAPQGASTLLEPLTERELEVLSLVADGLSNREISHRLYLSVGTVKAHVSHVYGKLLVRNRTRAIARARELQLLD